MYAIVACGIFEKELELLRPDLGFAFQAHYLAAGLHVDFDRLQAALAAKLEQCRSDGAEGIIVLYGQCHPGMDKILKPYHAALIDCQNCVDALITRKGMEDKAREGLLLLPLSGLAGCLEGYLPPHELGEWRRPEWPWAPSRDRSTSTPSKTHPVREKDLLEFFDFTNLPFQIMPVDLGHFRSIIIRAKESLED